jgi:hypothetical protein
LHILLDKGLGYDEEITVITGFGTSVIWQVWIKIMSGNLSCSVLRAGI